MNKLFRRKPEPELQEGEFDIRTWTPSNRSQARSAVAKGFIWYWDNSKRTLALALVGGLTLLGIIYNFRQVLMLYPEVAWIETMSAPNEIKAAAEAAITVGLPYTYTGSFDTAGRTMMGLAPDAIHDVGDQLAEHPVAVGANCGVGASDILASLLDMSAARPDATIIVKGNCGIPEFRGADIHYSGTPELMADYARLAIDGGARIVGGCCGTSFGHLAAMRAAIDGHTRGERPSVETIETRIGPLRNKLASQSGGDGNRRERRRPRG